MDTLICWGNWQITRVTGRESRGPWSGQGATHVIEHSGAEGRGVRRSSQTPGRNNALMQYS